MNFYSRFVILVLLDFRTNCTKQALIYVYVRLRLILSLFSHITLYSDRSGGYLFYKIV